MDLCNHIFGGLNLNWLVDAEIKKTLKKKNIRWFICSFSDTFYIIVGLIGSYVIKME